MDVGVITIHNHLNYGAVLQAYALNRTIRKLGHNCKTINCTIDPGSGRLSEKAKHTGATITKAYNFCRWLSNKRYAERFHNFIKQQIPLTDREYRSFDELEASPPRFDVFVTGSDQVWRPGLLDRPIGIVFHLGFISPEKARLISYAPSFGVSQIPPQFSEKIAVFLSRYHCLSIREKKGKDLIKDISGRDAVLVLDPTLLLSADDYDEILEIPEIKGEYILVYPMELGENMSFYNLVEQVAKQAALPVVCVLPLVYDFRWLKLAEKVVLDAGPREFLGLIRYASFVCTNSFHGTAFSIIFRKNFLGIPHTQSNSRIENLLEQTGLKNRQLKDLSSKIVKKMIDTKIDYAPVVRKLKKHVDDSTTYLEKALACSE